MTDGPVPPFTVTMLRAEVEGVLGQWLDSYTEPTDEDYAAGHHQRRMRTQLPVPVDGFPGSFTMDVSVRGDGEPDQEFKLTVTVQKIPAAERMS